MDQKRATEICDYFDEHPNTDLLEAADYLKLSLETVIDYKKNWKSKPRGEFIYYLTKQDGD